MHRPLLNQVSLFALKYLKLKSDFFYPLFFPQNWVYESSPSPPPTFFLHKQHPSNNRWFRCGEGYHPSRLNRVDLSPLRHPSAAIDRQNCGAVLPYTENGQICSKFKCPSKPVSHEIRLTTFYALENNLIPKMKIQYDWKRINILKTPFNWKMWGWNWDPKSIYFFIFIWQRRFRAEHGQCSSINEEAPRAIDAVEGKENRSYMNYHIVPLRSTSPWGHPTKET